MKPIKFKEQNFEFQPPKGKEGQVGSLPCHIDEKGKQVIAKWKLGPIERIKALLFGTVWVGIQQSPPPPMWIGTKYPFTFGQRIGKIGIFQTRFAQMIINMFQPTCGECIYHSGWKHCSKLKGIIDKDNPICGHFKKFEKKVKKGKK